MTTLIPASQARLVEGRSMLGMGFANSGGLVFMDQSAEEIATL
jgi:hypothetical protein